MTAPPPAYHWPPTWIPWWLVDDVIPAGVADVLRLGSMVGSLVLLVCACYAAIFSPHGDQRVRFGIFAVLPFLLTAGHLERLAQPGPWRLAVLPALVVAAIWSTLKYVRREIGDRRRDR